MKTITPGSRSQDAMSGLSEWRCVLRKQRVYYSKHEL